MGKVTFIEHSGEAHEVDIEDGKSLMELAMDNDVPGIDADCGGACACGTCHVLVEKKWLAAAGTPNEDENNLLDLTPEKSAESRLACQITASESMDGMTVRLPEFQM